MSMVTCLTLFGLRTREHSQAGQLSGKAQCIGYLIGALGPYLAGIIRGHSLNWNSVLLCIRWYKPILHGTPVRTDSFEYNR